MITTVVSQAKLTIGKIGSQGPAQANPIFLLSVGSFIGHERWRIAKSPATVL
jgi:hypothetical protein